MFIPKNISIKSRILLICLVVVLVFISSMLWVLSYPNTAKAQWDAERSRLYTLLDHIAIAAWKIVALPLLRTFIITIASGSTDFPLYPEVFYRMFDQLLGQVIDTVTRTLFGISLCTQLKLEINALIGVLLSDPKYSPYPLSCTFTEMLENFIPEIDFDLNLFATKVVNNDFTQFSAAFNTVVAEQEKIGTFDLSKEIGLGDGFLGIKRCEFDKELQEEVCKNVAPAAYVRGVVGDAIGVGEIKNLAASTILTDLLVLLEEAINTTIQTVTGQIAVQVMGSIK